MYVYPSRINPLQIVTLSHQDSNGDCIATTVSTQGTVQLAWEHGELRGGSNIVLLRQRKEYLGLFHSIGGFAYEAKKTYFMGAFTFSAEPPFQLLSVSHQPILDKDNALYDGMSSQSSIFQNIIMAELIAFYITDACILPYLHTFVDTYTNARVLLT